MLLSVGVDGGDVVEVVESVEEFLDFFGGVLVCRDCGSGDILEVGVFDFVALVEKYLPDFGEVGGGGVDGGAVGFFGDVFGTGVEDG